MQGPVGSKLPQRFDKAVVGDGQERLLPEAAAKAAQYMEWVVHEPDGQGNPGLGQKGGGNSLVIQAGPVYGEQSGRRFPGEQGG